MAGVQLIRVNRNGLQMNGRPGSVDTVQTGRTFDIVDRVEARGRAAAFLIDQLLVKLTDELARFVALLLANRTTLGAEKVAQVYSVNGRTRFLIQLQNQNSNNSMIILVLYYCY